MSRYFIDNKALEEAMFRFRESKRELVRYDYLMEDIHQAIRLKSKKRRNVERETQVLRGLAAMHSQVQVTFGEMQEYLARQFLLLAENLVRYAKFAVDADDAVQDCVMTCFDKIDRFDPTKGKAFNYLTTCCMNGLKQGYRTAKNYNELRRKYYMFQTTCGGHTVVKNGREMTVFDGGIS